MAILGYEWADFVVWTPKEVSIRRVDFDAAYWQTSLQPALRAFYQSRPRPWFPRSLRPSHTYNHKMGDESPSRAYFGLD